MSSVSQHVHCISVYIDLCSYINLQGWKGHGFRGHTHAHVTARSRSRLWRVDGSAAAWRWYHSNKISRLSSDELIISLRWTHARHFLNLSSAITGVLWRNLLSMTVIEGRKATSMQLVNWKCWFIYCQTDSGGRVHHSCTCLLTMQSKEWHSVNIRGAQRAEVSLDCLRKYSTFWIFKH